MLEAESRPSQHLAPPTRCYQIEYWVQSGVRSHGGQSVGFRVGAAMVALRLPAAEAQQDGLMAAVTLSEMALLTAERAAHDALAKVLDLLAFEMKLAATVMHRFRSQVEGTGEIRHCVVYLVERRERSLFLMPGAADEVQRLLDSPPANVETALYWLRWSYAARRVPDAFLFTWMALEQLAGVDEITSQCQRCRAPVVCPTHGPHIRKGVSRRSIKALLNRHDVEIPDRLLDLRNPLVHGGLVYTFEKRFAMNQMLSALRHTVEEELKERLKAYAALDIPSAGRSGGYLETSVHCEYRTAHPSEPFPPDAPTHEEVTEHQEDFRKGQKHPKIIDVLSYPPNW